MFCKNCGVQLNDNAAFCPNCGTPVGVIRASEAENTAGVAQGYSQPQGVSYPQGYSQPQGYGRPAKKASKFDLMSIISLCASGISIIMGVFSVIKGVNLAIDAGSPQGIMGIIQQGLSYVESLFSDVKPANPGIRIIIIGGVAFALGLFALILANRRKKAIGENIFNKLGSFLGVIGLLLGAAGVIFAIIGAIRYNNYIKSMGVNSIYDLLNHLDSGDINDFFSEVSDWLNDF